MIVVMQQKRVAPQWFCDALHLGATLVTEQCNSRKIDDISLACRKSSSVGERSIKVIRSNGYLHSRQLPLFEQ